jgi:hypothetical protein
LSYLHSETLKFCLELELSDSVRTFRYSDIVGLIAMAQDVESLYAAVKALVCVVRTNRTAQLEMDRRRGYQTLAMLLRRKRPLLNSHILHLTFSLVGTVDSGKESSSIPNTTAFQDLLCDIEVVSRTEIFFYEFCKSQIA